MSPCDRMRPLIVDRLYGAIDRPEEDRALRDHLASCTSCASEDAALRRLTAALRVEEAFPREAEVDWNAFARRTVSRAVREQGGAWRAVLRGLAALGRPTTVSFTPAWAGAAALVMLIGVALLGYSLRPGPAAPGGTMTTGPTAGTQVIIPEESLDRLAVNLARRNTAQYLRETRSVLITLLDLEIGCNEDAVDISAERAKAMELLRRQRLVAVELGRVPLMRARDVTEDLQTLLLEISSLADCTPSGDIETLRQVVDQRQILVRMELLTQELARRGGADV